MTRAAQLETHLATAAQAHGHVCAGQVLGVRLAMLGLEKLGIDDPRGKDRKRLVTFVEIDRCATDAVAVVTGCRLGKRALKFRDWGKMAATFVDVSSGQAVRIAAKESSKTLARQMHPELEDKNQQQMLAYREMGDDDLFTVQWVKVDLPPKNFRDTRVKELYVRYVVKESTSIAKSFATENDSANPVPATATTKPWKGAWEKSRNPRRKSENWVSSWIATKKAIYCRSSACRWKIGRLCFLKLSSARAAADSAKAISRRCLSPSNGNRRAAAICSKTRLGRITWPRKRKLLQELQ